MSLSPTLTSAFALLWVLTALPNEVSAFRICGRARERPGGNAPIARFVFYFLEPGGRSTQSFSSGIFCFEDVQAGEYALSIREYIGAPAACTEYGCWPETRVVVTDADILDLDIPMVPLPGPTPTPAGGQCSGDADGDHVVTIDELVLAVRHALEGCPAE